MKSYPHVAGGTAQVRIPVIMRSSTDGSLLAGLANTAMTVNYQINGSTTGVTVGAGTPGTWGSGHWTAASHSSGGAAKAGHYEFGVPAACFQTDDVVVTIAFSATGAITTVVKFHVGTMGAVSVAAGGIVAASFGADCITAAAIADNAIVAANLANGLITSTKFGSSAITNTAIAANAITSANIAANAINSTDVDASLITAIQNGLATSAQSVAVLEDTGLIKSTLATIVGLWSGITSMANWLRAMVRKSAPDATAASEINSGGGTYDATSDSPEAIRDRGDAAWVTANVSGLMTAAGYTAPDNASIAAIKAKTDNLPASPAAAGEYTAAIADIPTVAEFNARSLPAADYTIVSDLSGLSTLDAAGVRTAVGLASANLDTQLADLPTVAEFELRSLPSADYTVVGDLSGLSTLTAQGVWEYATRELTSAGAGGATAQEVWEYATRTVQLAADQTAVGAITFGPVKFAANSASVPAVWITQAHEDGKALLIENDESGIALNVAGLYSVQSYELTGAFSAYAETAAIADAVWDEAQSGHTSAGTFGLYLDGKVSEAGGGGLTAESVADAVWDEVLSGHATAGTAGAGLAAAQSAGDPWATSLPGSYASGTAGAVVSNLPSAAGIATLLAARTNINVIAPVTAGTIDIVKGDAWAASPRVLDFTLIAGEYWPTTLSTVDFTATPNAATLAADADAASLTRIAGTVTTATGDSRAVRITLTAAQTATLTAAGANGYNWWIVANRATAPATLRKGTMTVREGT